MMGDNVARTWLNHWSATRSGRSSRRCSHLNLLNPKADARASPIARHSLASSSCSKLDCPGSTYPRNSAAAVASPAGAACASGSKLACGTACTWPCSIDSEQLTGSTGRAPAWMRRASRQKGGRSGPGGRPEPDRPWQSGVEAAPPGRPPGPPTRGLAHAGQRPRLGCFRGPDRGGRADQAAMGSTSAAARQTACGQGL